MLLVEIHYILRWLFYFLCYNACVLKGNKEEDRAYYEAELR